MRDSLSSCEMRGLLGVMPSTHLSANDSAASPRRRMDCRSELIIIGLKTLSSKCPLDPAMLMPVWFPMTWQHTMVSASHCVGLTLPGMMLLPGSFSGRLSSPRPQRGPLPRNLMSLATFIREQATVLRCPLASTMASCAARASNLLGAVTKGSPVSAATSAATCSAKPSNVLRPVPTAVPPCAILYSAGSADSTLSMPLITCAAYPLNSCPRVRGVASCVWVLPIFTIAENSAAFASSDVWSFSSLGMRLWVISVAAAMCITVGKVSLELCPLLTWSFGWTIFDPSSPPRISIALLAMTSFAFMLLCVPLPVCQTTRGKWSVSFPSATSVAALIMASPIVASMPALTLTFATDRFNMPNALTTGSCITSLLPPILKFIVDLWVCAPQYLRGKHSLS
mmetsp:Transcript_17790/g.42698  ORF Transcript_17790/g.42698 Transcript_17790/m.42698 type:complete len:396 (-) Transcript_17790:392-1579(-)